MLVGGGILVLGGCVDGVGRPVFDAQGARVVGIPLGPGGGSATGGRLSGLRRFVDGILEVTLGNTVVDIGGKVVLGAALG